MAGQSVRTWVDPERAKTVGVTGVVFALVCGLVPRSAPGSTVSEQRALLPPAASCDDPVTGVWKSHNYRESRSRWVERSIEIRRDAIGSDDLIGQAFYHGWNGSSDSPNPPTCDETDRRVEVSMPARGRSDGLTVEVWGVEPWRLIRNHCDPDGYFGYNLDHFSGTIDPERQEFQSVNNDGGSSVDEPVVFRRIRCFDTPASTVVEPPPFQPVPSRGCGLW